MDQIWLSLKHVGVILIEPKGSLQALASGSSCVLSNFAEQGSRGCLQLDARKTRRDQLGSHDLLYVGTDRSGELSFQCRELSMEQQRK